MKTNPSILLFLLVGPNCGTLRSNLLVPNLHMLTPAHRLLPPPTSRQRRPTASVIVKALTAVKLPWTFASLGNARVQPLRSLILVQLNLSLTPLWLHVVACLESPYQPH